MLVDELAIKKVPIWWSISELKILLKNFLYRITKVVNIYHINLWSCSTNFPDNCRAFFIYSV